MAGDEFHDTTVNEALELATETSHDWCAEARLATIGGNSVVAQAESDLEREFESGRNGTGGLANDGQELRDDESGEFGVLATGSDGVHVDVGEDIVVAGHSDAR